MILQSAMYVGDLLKALPKKPTTAELEQYGMLLRRSFCSGGLLSVGDGIALNCIVQRHATLFRELDLPRGDKRFDTYEYELTQSKLALMRAAMSRVAD